MVPAPAQTHATVCLLTRVLAARTRFASVNLPPIPQFALVMVLALRQTLVVAQQNIQDLFALIRYVTLRHPQIQLYVVDMVHVLLQTYVHVLQTIKEHFAIWQSVTGKYKVIQLYAQVTDLAQRQTHVVAALDTHLQIAHYQFAIPRTR